nr:tetratricopeptide repeat protein [candidate division Zixibacteria bacterium]
MISKLLRGKMSIFIALMLVLGMVVATSIARADTEKAKEHFNTGLTLSKDGNDSLAVMEYNQAIKEDPNFVDAYINLGSIYFAGENLGEAEKMFKKVTEIAPDNADGWANLGRTYYKQKKNIEAEQAYKTVIQKNPNYNEIYKDLGLLYYNSQPSNWPALIENMQVYTSRVTDDYLAFYLIGKGYQKMKKYPEAIEAFNKTIALKKDYFNAYNSLGQIYQDQDKNKEAYQMYQKAVDADPGNYKAYYNLAISYETVYQEDKAKIDQIIDYWSKFLKVAKSNSRAKSMVDGAEEHLTQLKELKTHYEEEAAGKY